MTFSFLPPAKEELISAAKHYERAVPGLGFDFLNEVRLSIERILSHPEAWTPLDRAVRRCRTHRFPYGVIYTVESGSVLIISVMHLHRHPDSWRKNRPQGHP